MARPETSSENQTFKIVVYKVLLPLLLGSVILTVIDNAMGVPEMTPVVHVIHNLTHYGMGGFIAVLVMRTR